MISSEVKRRIAEILYESGRINRQEECSFFSLFSFQTISADGSQRAFFRVLYKNKSICVGVLPDISAENGLAEALSTRRIGEHLFNRGVPVPEILGADDESGLVLFEDCGDTRLHDLLVTPGGIAGYSEGRISSFYREIIKILVRMQVHGVIGLNTEWCYDTSHYDRQIMVTREAEYFLNAFWYDLLSGEKCLGIEEEFEEIALQSGRGINSLFLHRDFQCRNIMIVDSKIRIIDFQGGRIGPPGYDLASLLIDPYSSLPPQFREELFQQYQDELHTYMDYDSKEFCHQYIHLVLQRNLQILGAYSFLYKQRQKTFFLKYIVPSLMMLEKILQESELTPYKRLRTVVENAQKRVKSVLNI